jgi:hypothetical protein
MHTLAVLFSLVMWAFMLGILVPKIVRFAIKHQDAIRSGIGAIRRTMGW